MGAAIRTSETSWTMDILADPNMALWQAEALERRYASSIALPLLSHGEAFRMLALYAGETDAFTESTIEQVYGFGEQPGVWRDGACTRDERKKGGKRKFVSSTLRLKSGWPSARLNLSDRTISLRARKSGCASTAS